MNTFSTSFTILLIAFSSVLHSVCAEHLRPVSSPTRHSISAAGNSYNPIFSADGRYLVFVSQANNLVTNAAPLPCLNVFAHDLLTSNTLLVSASASGWGGGNADCNYPAISSNGQFIAFASAASNLVANDTNEAADIFLRDLTTGVTHLISANLTGNSSSPPFTNQFRNVPVCGNPLISGNGRLIFFESIAPDLCSIEDKNLATDVFVRDTLSNITRLVSIESAATSTGSGASALGSITPDARWVAFASKATNLVNGSRPSGRQEIFVRDLHLEQTYWASVDALGSTGSVTNFYAPVLSANGACLYFKKAAVNLSDTAPEELWRFDLQTQAAICIATNALPYDLPAVSPDGDYVVYAGLDGLYAWHQTTQTNLFIGSGSSPALASRTGALVYKVTDSSSVMATGIYGQNSLEELPVLLSVQSANAPAGIIEAAVPAISPDGRFVAFESMDEGIVTNDLNQASDIFVRDRLRNSTWLLSQSHAELPAMTGAGLSSLALSGTRYFTLTPARSSLDWDGCISADGRVAVFTTLDSSLASRDTNRAADIFAKYLQTGEVIPVSVELGDVTNGPFPVDRAGSAPVISGNGQRVAWVWRYTTNGTYLPFGREIADVYIRDLVAGSNYQLVSRTTDGLASGNSSQPAISSDGTMVAFRSGVPGLVDYVRTESSSNAIYVRYLNTGTNQAVSVTSDGRWLFGNGGFPVFTANDEWILFQCSERLTTNSVPYNTFQLFARNLKSQTTRLISYGPNGAGLGSEARGVVTSADSRYVAFYSSGTIYRHDLQANTTNLVVCESCENPFMTADGRLVVYKTRGSSFPPFMISDVYIKDMVTGETNLISVDRSGTGGGSAHSSTPIISYDGRFVVFASSATNLVDIPVTGTGDLYLRDRVLGTTMLLSINRQGTAGGNAKSSYPVLSGDGRTVIFQSFAEDLTEGDYNFTRDVFVLRLASPDTDADGLEDGWEVAYFGNLTRDGSGDFDSDGQTDREEFLAGTDPTNQGSVFSAMTMTSVDGNSVRILWNAVPGRSYLVQYKDNITDPSWTDLGDAVVPNGTTGTKSDTTAMRALRFYRVVLQD